MTCQQFGCEHGARINIITDRSRPIGELPMEVSVLNIISWWDFVFNMI